MTERRVTRARDYHLAALKHKNDAEAARCRRDEIVRELYATGRWSYKTLAERVGCSAELIAYIVKNERLHELERRRARRQRAAQ